MHGWADDLDLSSFATPEQSIENLDKVRAIILDNSERLDMNSWHADSRWQRKTCGEEVACGTAHCLAGWLQVCATDPEVRNTDPELAGARQAPVASKMFYRSAGEVLKWLENRTYVLELAQQAEGV